MPPETCTPPQIMIPGIGCGCPDGGVLRNGKCVKLPKKPKAESCKRGFVWNGDMCVRRKAEPKEERSRELPEIRIPRGLPGFGGGGGRGEGGGGGAGGGGTPGRR